MVWDEDLIREAKMLLNFPFRGHFKEEKKNMF